VIDDLYESRCQQPSDISELMPVLRYFASLCESVTEFGVRGGNSTVAFLAGRPKTMVSIDIADGDPDFAAVDAAIGRQNFKFIRADVLEIDIKPTDLLFIDTDPHTNGQLRVELARHADNVKRYIILHDTEIFGAELNPAIEEFLAAHTEWREILRLRNCNGLTVLEREAE
jgi:hypothetical protein